MTAKRFTIQGQSIKHNDELLTLDMVCEMLNDYAEENERLKQQLKPIQKVCKKYHIPLKDLPEILEEYIAYDNDDNW